MRRDKRFSYDGGRVLRRAPGACAALGICFGRLRPLIWALAGQEAPQCAGNERADRPSVECLAVPQKDATGGVR